MQFPSNASSFRQGLRQSTKPEIFILFKRYYIEMTNMSIMIGQRYRISRLDIKIMGPHVCFRNPDGAGNGVGFSAVDPRMALIRKYGTIKNIPEEELRRHELFRLTSAGAGGAIKLIKADEYNNMRKFAFVLLSRKAPYHGYLFARDRIQLLHFLRGKSSEITLSKMQDIKGRAERFISEGIPPIFSSDFETYHREQILIGPEGMESSCAFPAVDFILEFVSGRYFQVRKAIAIEAKANELRKKLKKPKLAIQPATISDIFAFRTLAFRNEELDARVVKEIIYYVMNHFEFRTEEGKQKALPFLEKTIQMIAEQLKKLKPGARSFKPYVPEQGLQFLSDHLWFVAYSPEDIEIILDDCRNSSEVLSNYSLLKRLSFLFPEMISLSMYQNVQEIKMLENRNKILKDIEESIKDKSVRINESLYKMAKDIGRQKIILEAIRKRCQDLLDQDPKTLLGVYYELDRPLNLSAILLLEEEIKRLIFIYKRIAVARLSDREVFEFISSGGYQIHIKSNYSTDYGMEYIKALKEKYLRGKRKA